MSVRPVVRPRSELFLETPASGRLEPRPGGGVRAALAPSSPGEGSASLPSSLRRGGSGGGEGAEAEVGGASRPTPPPEQRVPAAAPCRSPRPRRRRRGAPLPWEPAPGRASTGRFPVRGTRSHFSRSRSEQLRPWQPELATCHLAWRPLSDFSKTTGSGAGVKCGEARTPETKVLVGGVFFF